MRGQNIAKAVKRAGQDAFLFRREVSAFALVYILILAALIVYDGGNLLYGIQPAAIPGEVDYRTVAGWAGITGLPYLAEGTILCRLDRIETPLLLRMGKRKRVCLYKLRLCLCVPLGQLLIQMAVIALSGVWSRLQLAVLLLFVNDLFWTVVLLVLYTVCRGRELFRTGFFMIYYACLLTGEYIPQIRPFLPTEWAMLCRAEIPSGVWRFSLYSIAAAGVMTLLYFLVMHMREVKGERN